MGLVARSTYCLASSCFYNDRYYYHYDAHKMSRLAILCISSSECEMPSSAQIIEQIKCLFIYSIHKFGALPIEGHCLKELSYVDLQTITDGFSSDSFIGKTQFGDFYRGTIEGDCDGCQPREVTIKIFRDAPVMCYQMEKLKFVDRMHRLKDEMTFLRHLKSTCQHPNLPKLIGFCCENKVMAVVYELKTMGVLHDYLSKGGYNWYMVCTTRWIDDDTVSNDVVYCDRCLIDSFKWVDRMKAIKEVTHLLQFMHDYNPTYIVGNISSRHLLFDQDMRFVLVDFGMLTGGILGGKKVDKYLKFGGAAGYMNPGVLAVGHWSPRADVYAFGVLVLELMSKKYMLGGGCESIRSLLINKKIPPYSSLIDDRLKTDPWYLSSDAEDMIEVVLCCLYVLPPFLTMNAIVYRLDKLGLYCPSKQMMLIETTKLV